MEYEWNLAKEALNRRKHGVSFTAAARALEDPRKLELLDDRFDYREERIQSIGIDHGVVLFVVTVMRSESLCAASSAPERQRVMSRKNTSKLVRFSTDRLPRDRTDWARVKALSDEEVMAAALSDPDAKPLRAAQLAKMRRVSRVKAVRQRLGMTQEAFARAFHLPISTLRDWEQHRSKPDAPARALLLAIERNPALMRRLLADKAA